MPTSTVSTADIRSEPRGPHWIAWVNDAKGKPEESVVLVGRTRDEAEARARQWFGARRLEA